MDVPELRRAGPLDFVQGFALPFRALALLLMTPRLAALTLAIAAVTLATLGALVAVLFAVLCRPSAGPLLAVNVDDG